MAEKAVDIPAKAEPLEPGEPVEASAVSQMGATFAERAGKKAPPNAKKPNSSFADRAKSVDSADVEDKSVKAAASKKS